MSEPKIKNFGLRSHMLMENCGIRIDAGTIEWEGNPIHGKTIVRETYTPKTKMKGWGKGECTYFLDEDKSPEFKTAKEFVEHYRVKEEPKKEEPPPLPRVKVKPEALEKRMKELKRKKK
jgi:hypothetical protein